MLGLGGIGGGIRSWELWGCGLCLVEGCWRIVWSFLREGLLGFSEISFDY